MSLTEKISHAAERKAFETILDSMLKKGQTQDVGDLAEQLIDMIQKIHNPACKISSDIRKTTNTKCLNNNPFDMHHNQHVKDHRIHAWNQFEQEYIFT